MKSTKISRIMPSCTTAGGLIKINHDAFTDTQEQYTSVGYVMRDKHAIIIVAKGKQIGDWYIYRSSVSLLRRQY